MNPLRRAMDNWFGRGEASITVPPMDGAFRPNDLLDSAATVLETPEPGCLAETSWGLVVSSGRSLFSVDRPDGAPVASFDAEISALAGLPDGGAAVGMIDGKIAFVGGQRRAQATGRQPRLSIWPSRGGRFVSRFGKLALRADTHFTRRRRPQ